MLWSIIGSDALKGREGSGERKSWGRWGEWDMWMVGERQWEREKKREWERERHTHTHTGGFIERKR